MDDDDLVMQMLINDLEDAEEQAANNIPRLYFQRQDPFLRLSELNFIKHFRLSKDCFVALLDELTPLLQARQRISGLSFQTKLLVTLLFFGQGSYQAVTGSKLFCGISQSSVSRCIEEVTNSLNRPKIISRWIRFPQNIEELLQRRTSFFHSTGIPGGIGVIDCTHVAIVRPTEEEHIYVNRKSYHSLNVQLVCDENLEIMSVNTNFPGSTHDAYIWGQSNILNILERVYRREPQNNFFLLEDSGYPLRPWLLTPMRNPAPGAEERFNNDFKRVRSSIERCNGVLKNRFRCLLKNRVLHYRPRKAAKIIIACCVLHNICTRNRIPEPDRDDEFLNADLGIIQEIQAPGQNIQVAENDLEAGRLLRQLIINRHYN